MSRDRSQFTSSLAIRHASAPAVHGSAASAWHGTLIYESVTLTRSWPMPLHAALAGVPGLAAAVCPGEHSARARLVSVSGWSPQIAGDFEERLRRAPFAPQ